MRGRVVLVGAASAAGGLLFFLGDPRETRTYESIATAGMGVLRSLDPETAHGLSITLCRLGLAPRALESKRKAGLQLKVMGMVFDSPVGLAAGYDKQAQVIPALLDMGFGFVEVGGVTPLPQPGNPRPRMFRLPEDRAVINRFGLNSEGQDVVAERLVKFKEEGHSGVVGVNLAKNTASEDAVADYVAGMCRLGPLVDFVVLNVSCPNVKWTSKLSKNEDAMFRLVSQVQQARGAIPEASRPKLLLKLGPDMDAAGKRHMAKLALDCSVDGLVVSNTTSTRPNSLVSPDRDQKGGLSGEPLKVVAEQTLRDMYSLTGGHIPIIGVGGISSAQDAYRRIRAGASLVQIYTALVYDGPALVRRMNEELDELARKDGFRGVAEAIGADYRDAQSSKGVAVKK